MRHLLILAALLTANAAAVEPVEHIYQARVHITPAGTMEAVEPNESIVPQVAVMVVNAVQAATFTPATVNGEAAASKTNVWVKIRFEGVPADQSGQQLSATVVDVTQRNPHVRASVYPPLAMREGVSGKVWLELVLLPDGSVDKKLSRVAQSDIRAPNGRKLDRSRSGKDIEGAAMASAMAWRLFPEEVDGVVQPTRQIIALTYCARGERGGKGACQIFDSGPEEAPRFAADPAVKLAGLAVSGWPPGT